MNAKRYLCSRRRRHVVKVEQRFLRIARCKRFLGHLRIRYPAQSEYTKVVPQTAISLKIPMIAFQYQSVRLDRARGFYPVAVGISMERSCTSDLLPRRGSGIVNRIETYKANPFTAGADSPLLIFELTFGIISSDRNAACRSIATVGSCDIKSLLLSYLRRISSRRKRRSNI